MAGTATTPPCSISPGPLHTTLSPLPLPFTCRERGQMTGMQEHSSTVELLRHQFRHGEPALPLRHSARSALQRSADGKPDAGWIDDVLIVISELVQNVSQHTHSDGELIITIQPGTVLVEVGDSSTIVPRTQRPNPLQAGGRGLRLVDAISQQWGVRTCPEGKVVWAQLPASTIARQPKSA